MMDEARLLQFSVGALYSELLQQNSTEDAHPCKDEIEAALEQCFYCLYGHPNKRAKAKHLEDHGATPVLGVYSFLSVLTAIFQLNLCLIWVSSQLSFSTSYRISGTA